MMNIKEIYDSEEYREYLIASKNIDKYLERMYRDEQTRDVLESLNEKMDLMMDMIIQIIIKNTKKD